jgi:hypothetical protein
MLELVQEIKEALGVDTETIAGANDLQRCLLSLEVLGMASFTARALMGDPRDWLLELKEILKKMKEEKLAEKVSEIMLMI